MNPRNLLVLIAAATCLAPGCQDSRPDGRSPFAAIGRADALALHEGLPHRGNEPRAFEAELKSKPTVDLHGFPFYRGPLALKPEDAARLKALLGNPKGFTAFESEKKCGGFHPDYAVEWTVDGKVFHCLICFGCGEIMMYGPLGESRFDMKLDVKKALNATLQPYRKDRPEPLYSPG